MRKDVVVTEFQLKADGSAAVVKQISAIADADKKAKAQVAKPYTGAIPARVGAGGSGYGGAIPPKVPPIAVSAVPSLGKGGGGWTDTVSSAIDGLGASVTGGLQGLFQGATSIVSGLAGLVPGVGPILASLVGAFAAAAGAVVATLTMAAKQGLAAAAGKDQLERMLGDAQGGDLGKGKAVYREIATDYAKSSNFGTDTNAQGAMKLLGADLDWRKWLKVAEKFSQGKDDKLDQMVGAITRINSGGLGEAAESLRDLGIGRKQLEKEGLKYNKGGGIESTAEEFLAVIDRLAAKRGNLSGSGQNARIGNVEDVISQAWASFGEVISQSILPLMEQFGDAIQGLIDSGAIVAIGDAFNGLIDAIAGDAGAKLGDVFFDLSVQVAVFLDNLGIATEAIKKLGEVIQYIPGVWIAKQLGGLAGIGAVGEMFTDHTGREQTMRNQRRMNQEAREREAQRKKQEKKDAAPKVENKLDTLITETRRQTAEIVKSVSLDERLLGGGSVARGEFSDVKVAGTVGGDKVERAVGLIREALRDEMGGRSRTAARYAAV